MTRPDTPNILAITFLYYKDLARAEAFYRDVMGFPLVIDQDGLAKIMKICDGAHVGLVDEAHGMHKWAETRPVQLCVRVGDVDAWYAYAKALDLPNLSQAFRQRRHRHPRLRLRRPRGLPGRDPGGDAARSMSMSTLYVINPNSSRTVTDGHRRGHRPLRPMAEGLGVDIACLTLAEGPPASKARPGRPHDPASADPRRKPDRRRRLRHRLFRRSRPPRPARPDRQTRPRHPGGRRHTALTLGQRFGVIAILPASIPRHLRAFGRWA
jgi:lactoylglutathione lyase